MILCCMLSTIKLLDSEVKLTKCSAGLKKMFRLRVHENTLRRLLVQYSHHSTSKAVSEFLFDFNFPHSNCSQDSFRAFRLCEIQFVSTAEASKGAQLNSFQ